MVATPAGLATGPEFCGWFESQLRGATSEWIRRVRERLAGFRGLAADDRDGLLGGEAEALAAFARDRDEEALEGHFRQSLPRLLRMAVPLHENLAALSLGRDVLRERLRSDGDAPGPAWGNALLEVFDRASVLLVKAYEDANQLTELQKDLMQAEHLADLGRLSASVAHEIKNPIAGLRGAMEVISQVHKPGDPRFVIFQEALSQIRRLDNLVRDLLAYAKPVNLDLEPVPVELLVQSALPMLGEQIAQASVAFRASIPEGIPAVMADPQLLRQVLVNLIQNGIQAMAGGGLLEVTAQAENGEVAIRISDSGCGIPPDLVPSIFKPFFTTKHIGTGLGLSIVQRILHAHGGRCEVQSSPGRGSVFSILLPAAPGT